jgi:UPF0755 protein
LRRLRGRFVLVLCALVLTVNLTMMGANEVLQAPSDRGEALDVVVPVGSTAQVAQALATAGVVNDPLVFRAAVFFTRRQGPIRAGEYLFPARASLQQIMEILRFGAVVEHQVTIPEGLTGAQIAKILNAAPDAVGQVAAPPEGAVLPQTYAYTLGMRRAAILARAEAAMAAAVATAWAGRDRTIFLTSPDQAVTLASIVQEESPLVAELPKIAAVYENRLAMGMKLQADPTVIFAATGGAAADGQPIFRPDLANTSPYNTYVVEGLPPGPICSPGLAAIQAVLHPAASDALFFVATGTGGHVFSKDYRQHLANVAAYRAVAGQ